MTFKHRAVCVCVCVCREWRSHWKSDRSLVSTDCYLQMCLLLKNKRRASWTTSDGLLMTLISTSTSQDCSTAMRSSSTRSVCHSWHPRGQCGKVSSLKVVCCRVVRILHQRIKNSVHVTCTWTILCKILHTQNCRILSSLLIPLLWDKT